MVKVEFGIKCIDLDIGCKFYDLNCDLIVLFYMGKFYLFFFFEEMKVSVLMEKEEEEDVVEVDIENMEIEFVFFEDVDDEVVGGLEDLLDFGDDDVEFDDDDDDMFLEVDEDDEDDDMFGIISVNSDEDEV